MVVSLHVIFSALWAGAALPMVVLMFTKSLQNISELLAYNHANKLIDDWIIIDGNRKFFNRIVIILENDRLRRAF